MTKPRAADPLLAMEARRVELHAAMQAAWSAAERCCEVAANGVGTVESKRLDNLAESLHKTLWAHERTMCDTRATTPDGVKAQLGRLRDYCNPENGLPTDGRAMVVIDTISATLNGWGGCSMAQSFTPQAWVANMETLGYGLDFKEPQGGSPARLTAILFPRDAGGAVPAGYAELVADLTPDREAAVIDYLCERGQPFDALAFLAGGPVQ